jgi:uncharacterized membrane protein
VTQFEFVSAGLTIVLALGVARLLEGVSDSYDPARRYWLHFLWVITKLMQSAALFWSAWLTRDVPDRTFFQFLGLIATPSIFYLQVHALVTRTPEAVLDWREHFWKIRRWFFAANGLQVLVSASLNWANSESMDVRFLPLAVVLLFSIVGFFSSNERVHFAIGIVAFLNLMMGFGAFSYQNL